MIVESVRRTWKGRSVSATARWATFRSVSPDGWQRSSMLETIAIILIILWLLGLVSSYTMGGFIHILLVIAIVVILLRVVQGRRPLQ
jgi:hypothetical protein